MKRFFLFAVLMTSCFGFSQAAPAPAQASSASQATDQKIKDLEERVIALEGQLRMLQSKQQAVAAPPTTTAPATPSPTSQAAAPEQAEVTAENGQVPVYGGATGQAKALNPDISLIGDFLAAVGHNTARPVPTLEMHETELGLQAIIDPYARADAFISFGEEGVNLEEGYLTFTALPAGIVARAGKMRAAFGKVNTLHNHILSWTDRPLVTQNLVGGEDGIDDAGVSVARLIPNPWFFLEATGQVFRGDSGDLYKSSKRSDLSYVGHLRGYHDISESSNIDLGFSYSSGHNDAAANIVNENPLGDFKTQLYGVDATFRWKPLQRSLYHSFIGRSEFIWSRRDQPNGLQASTGFYVSGAYQVGRRWYTGARLDRSDRATDSSLTDTGASFIVTYWPSEFSQVRAQYRRTNYALAESANEILFQFQFSIGAHGAHPF